MTSLKKASLIVIFLAFTSCYERLDFSQAEDYSLKPIVTVALTYFTAVPSQFFDTAGVQQNSITDVTDFKGFENSIARNNIVKIDFNTEIINEFDRDVTIQVQLLDDTDSVVYASMPIIVPSENLNYKYLEEIYIASTPAILNTTQVSIQASLENNTTPMDAKDSSKFEFKSSLTLYVEFDL